MLPVLYLIRSFACTAPNQSWCCALKCGFVFRDAETGYMQDDTATFTAAFHVIKETCTFSRSIERIGAKARAVKSKSVSTGENFQGKFVWKIEHFTRLKDILKKRKITGLCVKSKRFTVGGRDCRLIVYPRGTADCALLRHHPLCFLLSHASQHQSWTTALSRLQSIDCHFA